MGDRELLDKLAQTPEDRLILSRALDKYQQSQTRRRAASTHFLSERERTLCERLTRALGEPPHRFWGGFEMAERTVLTFFSEDRGARPETVAVLTASYPKDSALTHRDFLGSLMGLGISREMVGDILTADGCAQVCVLAEMAPFLLDNWKSAGRAPLRVMAAREGVTLAVPERELRKGTLSSLRLDSVVGLAFHLSRGDAAELVTGGKVSLNHAVCQKPDRTVAEGDVFSAAGEGKACLQEVGGITRKGRVAVTLALYR